MAMKGGELIVVKLIAIAKSGRVNIAAKAVNVPLNHGLLASSI